MTESKAPLASEKTSESPAKVSSSKDTTTKNTPKIAEPKKTDSNKTSKLAIFAVLIAIAAPAGHYYWQQLQNQQLTQALTSKISGENNAILNRYQNQMQQALTGQQQAFAKQLQEVATQIHNVSQAKITELDTAIKDLEQRIKQRQPSDWLLHETEYLIRIAARTLWLEHNTSAAIGLLKDADARLTELNDPAFLPVRETIHQDIKSLELMPKLDTDEIVLELMAMKKQVAQLPLAIVDLGKESDSEADFNLSADINDWQTNLAKTWQKFLNDFIRVRQRTGSIEPLMSPDQQENLKQNLNLKIQLALWAASERKGDIYQKTLIDIQQWINEFFDMENSINQHFEKSLASLKEKQVAYDYPSELGSLTAIRTTLRNQQARPVLPFVTEANEADSEPLQKPKDEVKAEPKKPVQQPEQQSDKPENEDNA